MGNPNPFSLVVSSMGWWLWVDGHLPIVGTPGRSLVMLRLSPFITVYCSVLAALLGACMASFLNCFSWRIVHGESVIGGRSHCDECGHVLSVRDLVPVFSYLFSHGKCRYCGKKLSSRHLWGEIIGGASFVLALFKYDISLQLLEAWLLGSILMACAFADLEGYIIPDRFIIGGIILFGLSFIWQTDRLSRLINGALGGIAVPAVLYIIVLVIEKRLGREAMGGGDIKLLAVTGLFLGFIGNFLCLIIACVFGIITGIVSGRRDEPIPWGPSIAAAAWITYLYGGYVINWYLSLF